MSNYDSLLINQMKGLKETEAMVKREIKILTAKLDRIWKMQDDIIEAVKAEAEKEEAEKKE